MIESTSVEMTDRLAKTILSDRLSVKTAELSADSHGTVRLRLVPDLAIINLRIDPTRAGVMDSIVAAVGLEVPTTPNASCHRGSNSCLWLGPDEWLIVSAGAKPDTLERSLRSALSLDWGSVVDVSDQYAVLELSGSEGRQVIAHGCSLDTHPRTWPVGACAQTLLASMQVVLHHVEPGPTFHVYVRRSLADYLVTWLLDASEEYVGHAMSELAPLPRFTS